MATPILTFEIKGLKELQDKLNEDDFKDGISTALMLGAGTARTIVQKYPSQRRGRKQPFKTGKQRRYFFAALKSGKIRVPYRRSGLLGRKWKTFLARWNVARVSNSTSYGPVVQLRSEQSRFHKKGDWKTTDDVAEQDEGAIVKEISRGIENYIKGLS